MPSVQIYGVPISRSIRNIWAALELGIPYENVPIGWDDDSIHGDAFRAINPNQRVPAMRDGEFVLWESLAINLYLVRKHGGEIAARTLEEEALAWQWSLWATNHLEPPLGRWAMHSFIFDEGERKPEVAAKAMQDARPLLAVLDGELGKRAFLAADRFTVADLNLGGVMMRPRQKLDFTGLPNLARWDEAVFSRPAARRAWAIRVAAAAKQ